MELEKAIHDFLVNVAGTASKVKGISSVQLTNLKNGNSGISTKKLKEVLILNGITGELVLHIKGTVTTIKL